jgi:hypothetical protein
MSRATGDNEQLGRANMVRSAGAALLPSILFRCRLLHVKSGFAVSYFGRYGSTPRRFVASKSAYKSLIWLY